MLMFFHKSLMIDICVIYLVIILKVTRKCGLKFAIISNLLKFCTCHIKSICFAFIIIFLVPNLPTMVLHQIFFDKWSYINSITEYDSKFRM